MAKGEMLKFLRKQRGYSQEQIARKLGVTQGTVSNWENGTAEPSAKKLTALAEIYCVSVDTLMGHAVGDQEAVDTDTMQLREQLRRRPEMKVLFDAAGKATPEQINAVVAMLEVMGGTKRD